MYSSMWIGRVLLVASTCCACAFANDAESRLVHTTQGPVKGYRAPEGDLFEFYSIPYASAPTGKNRFKAPLPAPVWISPFEAVDKRIACPQADFMDLVAYQTMQEDCLIANVFVPDTEESNLPVLVIVHGGAYQIGSGQIATPKQLVKSKKIIAVTFNYRLGAHGFLCLGTEDAPGNAGMKDQVALLRWVNKNIASFGGNPNDVTIDGYSAGSSSVDLLMLSKSAKGLFHRAIPESGANVASWSVQIDPIENAKEYARILGFENVDDINALEEFYKSASYSLLGTESFLDRNNFLFTPCVERDTGVERFLDDYPVNILKKGNYNKVPVLYGFANMEGLFRVHIAYDKFVKGMNEKFSDYLPDDLQFKDEEEKERVASEVKQFYFGDKVIDENTILGYIDYYTDVMFAYPTLRSLKLQVEAGNKNIYLYEYSLFVDVPLQPMLEKPAVKIEGAAHCAQTMAVFDGLGSAGSGDESNIPEDLKKMKVIIRKFWLNFITTGAPVPKNASDLPAWPAAGADRSPYMDLNLEPKLKGQLLPNRARLWDDIYDKYYRAPAPPPTPPPKHTEL